MAASGAGRGRGWLNLNKNSTLPRPGGIQSSNESQNTDSSSTVHAKILTAIEALDRNDDGILLNQKLQNILECFKQECHSANKVEETFKVLYQKCYKDSNLASKLVLMVSSYSFISAEVHSVKLRNLFIGLIQNDFENSKKLQTTNPVAFQNAVRMLGEFYSKARLIDGRQIKFLAAPLLRYLEMLIESAQPPDLEVFTIQLFLNGNTIKAEYPHKLNEIMIKIRALLACDTQLTKISKLWLLLALDVEIHNFGLLAPELQKFYQEQLGDSAMVNFQGCHNPLSVDISYSNKALDGYQSSVNVLQVSPPESTSPVSDSSSVKQSTNSTSNKFSSQKDSEVSQSTDSSTDWETSKEGSGGNATGNAEKVGRPILGVGARLLKNKNVNDSNNWGNEDKKWDNKQKGANSKGWGGNRKGPNTSKNKGWEHDDRFETVYQ